jgi:hypothetical protein
VSVHSAMGGGVVVMSQALTCEVQRLDLVRFTWNAYEQRPPATSVQDFASGIVMPGNVMCVAIITLLLRSVWAVVALTLRLGHGICGRMFAVHLLNVVCWINHAQHSSMPGVGCSVPEACSSQVDSRL